MKLLATTGFLLVSGCAHALSHHITGTASCPYPVDNGCAASTAGGTLSPNNRNINFAYDTAQSGQLSTTPSPSDISARNALIHSANANLPFVDYAIGSNDPATLTPISSYLGDGTCIYTSTGAYFGNGPVLKCIAVSGSPAEEVISGYDFSNIGGGTGTACVSLNFINSTVKTINYKVKNDYFQAQGSCWAGASGAPSTMITHRASGTGNPATLLTFDHVTIDGNYRGSLSGVTAPARVVGSIAPDGGTGNSILTIDSVTYGTVAVGQFLTDNNNSPVLVIGTQVLSNIDATHWEVSKVNTRADPDIITLVSPAPTVVGIIDSRISTVNYPLTVTYSIFKDLGHNPMIGSTGGDLDFEYNAFIGNCVSPGSLCHGETAEMTGTGSRPGGTIRNVTYNGNIFLRTSTDLNSSDTTAFYITAGNPSNVQFTNVKVTNNVVIANNTNCANAPNGSFPYYSPVNPCGTGQVGNGGLYSMGYTSYVANFNLSNNVIDGTGASHCGINNGATFNASNGTGKAVFTIPTNGTLMTITTPAVTFSNSSNFVSPIWPGNLLFYSTSQTPQPPYSSAVKDGWNPNGIVVASIGDWALPGNTIDPSDTYINEGTINNTSGCVPGTNGGCGVITLATPYTGPGISQTGFLTAYAAILNPPIIFNNWSIGGVLGTTARAALFTQPVLGSYQCP